MELVVAVGVGLVLVLAWVCVKWRREVELDRQLEALAVTWDSLTEGQRARRVQMRDATIGEIIRELPPVDSGADTHPY